MADEDLNELLSMSQASLKLGHTRTYLADRKRIHPEHFEGIELTYIASSMMIRWGDALEIMKKTKKEDVLLSGNSA